MVTLTDSPSTARPSLATLYAARAMIDLAQANARVSAAVIARRQQLPVYFLDQLLGRLRRAGLVTSLRGPHGGYALSRPPESITLAQIVTAVEGTQAWKPSAEILSGDVVFEQRIGCAVEEAWCMGMAAMHRLMHGIDLVTLARRQREFDQRFGF